MKRKYGINRKFLFGSCILLSCLLIFGFSASALNETVFHWYCVRNREHKQPIADSNMRWIERYHGYYIDHAHGDDCEEKVVYLTFDAGYENGNVSKILDTLKQEQVPGAFFILGHLVSQNPELVTRMVQEGHTVGNHTNRHRNMTKLRDFTAFEKEMKDLEKLYQQVIGQPIAPYYRPPEGCFDERSLLYAAKMGYRTIFWSFAYADWDNDKQPSPEEAKKKILDHMHNGAVLLLHPTSQTNAAILGEIIQTLKQQGYRFGTLDELVAGNPCPNDP